jgi:hypothetical protein
MLSLAAKQAALDALWGDNHGATMPATFEVGLITADPRVDTFAEIDYPGYARITGTNDGTFWNATNANGVKLSKIQTFPDSTAAGSNTGTHWAIWLPGGLVADVFDFGRLDEDITVTAAGAGPAIRIRRTFNTGLVH